MDNSDNIGKMAVKILLDSLEPRLDKMGISLKLFMESTGDNESDWAFIIKLHSMIEGTLNHIIVTRLGDERLFPIIARLEVGDQKRGKPAFVKALDLIPDHFRSFVKWMSEMRNSLVHNAQNLDFDLKRYLEENKEIQKNLFKAINKIFPKSDIYKMAEENVRTPFALATVMMIAMYAPPSNPPAKEPSESNLKE